MRKVIRKRVASEKAREQTALDNLCVQIFTSSAVMVGVCLTVIGLFRLIARLKNVATIGDDLLALDALLFLIACLLSYLALRSRRRRRLWESVADLMFLIGLALMTCVCALITYQLI